MRIISGNWRGRSLKVPPEARATTDRVREAIFSILDDPEGKEVLDLYAGSGSLGLEALSRGAQNVCFVDISRRAVIVIRENLRNLTVSQGEIIKRDALIFLRQNPQSYHWIFCDPPYDRVDYIKLLHTLADSTALGMNSLLILESDRYHSFVIPSAMELLDQRKFGDTIIHFIRRRQEAKGENDLPPAS